MHDSTLNLLAADLVLLVHVLFVIFLVVGLACVLVGGPLSWQWVRRPAWRVAHLAGIFIVAAQSWLGLVCPLTTWEMALRQQAGADTYRGSFVAHWLQRLLYFEAPAWVFALAYTAFGLLVAFCWVKVPPHWRRHRRLPRCAGRR